MQINYGIYDFILAKANPSFEYMAENIHTFEYPFAWQHCCGVPFGSF